MRTLALLVALVSTSVLAVGAQDNVAPEGTIIRSAEVSGIDFDDLSPGLRKEITSLAGTALSRERLRALAARIESEQPETVAAVRSAPREDGDVRIIFLVGRISDDGDLQSNINARYTVESVGISGVDETTIRQEVRDQLQKLVGSRLDPDEAERLDKLLADELPGRDVKRRIERGTQPGQIRVVFEVTEAEPQPWIPFAPSRSKFVYHSFQGWSGVLDIPIDGPRNHRFTLGLAFSNEDDLTEEYSGIRFRYESRKLATDRLGASIEFSELRETWREATLFALESDPSVPEAYRERWTIEPLVTFAFSPSVRITGGVSISELESHSRSPESQMASAGVFSLAFDKRWKGAAGAEQNAKASYELRTASATLDSDLDYTRHLVRAQYQYSHRHSTVTSDLLIGRITGEAPLFERFTLGDTSTLRGWNKYDIAPIGGTRSFHHSLDYRYRFVGVFLDTGSVWERNASVRTRLSTGFGLHTDNFFAMIGVPLNADDVRGTFIAGIRF
jgi:hypothetical protein